MWRRDLDSELPSAPVPRSWIDDEPGWDDAKQELRCIYSRLRVRWQWALLLTCLVTIVGSGWRARKQRTFQSTVVLRVTESNLDLTTAPPTSNQLQQHLYEVALSRRALFKLMADNKLYKEEYDIDPNFALEQFREDVELYVVSNYFSQERYSEDPPRSARIAISYTGRDPETTLSVARQLGQQVEAEQQRSRQDYSQAATQTSEEALSLARTQLLRARLRDAALKFELPRLAGEEQASAALELRRLATQIADLGRVIQLHTERGAEFQLRSEFEGQALGLRFELVDAGKQARVLLTNREAVAFFALFSFLFTFPMAALGVGTFDPRVRDAHSLKRLGLRPFGHIPEFAGIDRGSFAARLKS